MCGRKVKGMGLLHGIKCSNVMCNVYGTFTAPGLALLQGRLVSHKCSCQKLGDLTCFGFQVCFGDTFVIFSPFLAEVVLSDTVIESLPQKSF